MTDKMIAYDQDKCMEPSLSPHITRPNNFSLYWSAEVRPQGGYDLGEYYLPKFIVIFGCKKIEREMHCNNPGLKRQGNTKLHLFKTKIQPTMGF